MPSDVLVACLRSLVGKAGADLAMKPATCSSPHARCVIECSLPDADRGVHAAEPQRHRLLLEQAGDCIGVLVCLLERRS